MRSARRCRRTTRRGSGPEAGPCRRPSRSWPTTRRRTTRPSSTKRRAGLTSSCQSASDALEAALDRLSRSLPSVRAARLDGLLPHVTEAGRWELLSPLAREPEALTGFPWTGGFVAGQLWLAAALTGRDDFAAEAAAVTELLAPRAEQPTTHDLGFLFWPSAVLGFRATGEERYRALGLRAAESLVRRLLPSGVIQVI